MYPLTRRASVLIAIKLMPPVAIAVAIPPEALRRETVLPR